MSNGDHSFTARGDGKFTYCFGNQHWGANTKEVSFNVHGVVYVTESELPSDPIEIEGTRALILNPPFFGRGLDRDLHAWPCICFHVLTCGHLVRKLSNLVAEVKDEQQYIVMRERTHRNTAESTNARVKWWNLFVIGVVLGESIFQVWWLRRFFEVKRVI